MSPRAKVKAIFVTYFVVVFLAIVLSYTVSPHFVWFIILATLLLGPSRRRVRCPVCGTPAGYKKAIGKSIIGSWQLPDRCSNCGYDLTKISN